jgi:hypothetical protein
MSEAPVDNSSFRTTALASQPESSRQTLFDSPAGIASEDLKVPRIELQRTPGFLNRQFSNLSSISSSERAMIRPEIVRRQSLLSLDLGSGDSFEEPNFGSEAGSECSKLSETERRQAELRKMIVAIQSNINISPPEKAKRIQVLLDS